MSLVSAVQVRCPSCNTPFTAQMHRAIDATKEPRLKELLIQGRFNLAQCPQCGVQSALSAPFIYHDASKSLFYCFMPMNMGGSAIQQQQQIGQLTNQFVSSLPPEERKGYMLQPKLYLTMQSLIDDILAADGITKEHIEAIKQRAALLQDIAQSQSVEELERKVKESQDKIDDLFFQTLDDYIAQAQEENDLETAQGLSALRDEISLLTRPEGEIAQQAKQLAAEREEMLDKVINERDQERLRTLVSEGRPLMDYSFFLALADRIETAQASGNEIEARRLTKLRDTVLAMIDEQDEAARQSLMQAAEFLRTVIREQNPEQYLRENADRIDDAFFAVLNANIIEAQRRKDENAMKALAAIGTVAASILEEKAPPEVRLLNRVMRAEPEQRRALLQEERALLDDRFVALVDQMISQLPEENADLAGELRQLRDMAIDVRAQG